MLEAIRGATRSINMECYIFQHGRIGDEFIDALTRARAQRRQRDHRRRRDRQLHRCGAGRWRGCAPAGCRIQSYQALRWYSLHRINNRTHRELLIVDGTVGLRRRRRHRRLVGVSRRAAQARPWRDTMARIEGPVVAALQGVAAENWLECCGEILTGPDYFPDLEPCGDTTAFVVKSSPSDRATASRVTFQLLIEGADQTVRINTPYFLPDRALRRALVEHGAARRHDHRHRPRTRTPISTGCGSRAGGCGDSC